MSATSFRVIGHVHTRGRRARPVPKPRRALPVRLEPQRGHDQRAQLPYAARRAHVGHPHGSPDMGGISANGRVLWLSGRYNHEVYAIDTANGRLLARIPVGAGPHGLSVWPQPGRHSLGHAGILR